jgi:hypothetical protein
MLRPGTWLLEYARGNIPSLFPFALGDTLFSTLDTTDLVQQLGISARLMSKEALLWLKQKQTGGRFVPNLAALKRPDANGGAKTKRQAGRADAN